MTAPTGQLNDPKRLAALEGAGLLDTLPTEAFDRLTRLVTRILRVPVALVTLVDRDRQFFKSCVGLPEPWASSRETPLSHSFCQYTVITRQPLIISDARNSDLLRDNLAIRDLNVVAYAGIPLTGGSGEVLGTFCAIDSKPRDWSSEDIQTLSDLAAAASSEIELTRTLAIAHRAAQEAQRAAKERDEFLNATQDGVYTLDRNGNGLFVNRACETMLGYTPDEMLGRNIHNLVHHKYANGSPYPESECPITRAAVQGVPVHTAREVLWRKDGTSFPVAYASSPVFRDGALIGAVVRFTDITEMRRAQNGLELLAKSGKALSTSLDLDATLAAIADLALPELADMALLDVVQDGAVRRIVASHTDSELAAMFERARDYPPDLHEDGLQAEVIRTGHSMVISNVDDEWIERSGRAAEHVELMKAVHVGSIVIVPLRTHREVLGSLSLVRSMDRPAFDEADCDLAEELGRRAAVAVENARLYEAARKATAARDDMLGVVSHDLRNPVHTVFMSSSFLLDLLPEEKKIERQQARIIKRSAERANRLISDLLDITRIESGQFALDIRPHDVRSLLDEAIEQSQALAAEKGIALTCASVEREMTVRLDRDRVLQAIGNLVVNALKFTPKGGSVTLSALRENEMACLVVKDDGPGIDAEQLPRLFDRYWQANRLDKRGVGLGLSIVRGIAEAHGGSVAVETVMGEGSTFKLRIPVR